MELKILNELLRLIRKRTRQFELEARNALTDELETVYRAKAGEAESIYVIINNMKMKLLKERARDEAELASQGISAEIQ